MKIRVDGHVVEMDAWHYTIVRLSEQSLDAGTLTTRAIYDRERLKQSIKDEKKREFGDTPTKDQKKKKRKSE